MPYAIRLPDGRLVENIPDSVQPEEAKKRIIAAGLYKAPAPETTALGHAKELVKGLIPGAANLVESAAIGASALLPEEYEQSAREGIASVAGAVKKPFAAAPGYEDAVSRKLSESIGSVLPMLPLGALGLAGRAAAVGLGVGAGAGEARTRAEKEGATDEQRSTATALGTLPGALEAFAPLRIVSRLPDAATATGVQLVKRAFLAGGEEAAQEAASGFAQNLIAKGVYKPDQELIEGLGEQAAYGGATGAIVQGLLDLAIGRRARGTAATEPGTGGESPIDAAARQAAEAEAEKAAKQAEKAAKQAPPEIPPLPDTFAELVQFSEQVKAMPKSKARDDALKAARKKREEIVAAEVTAGRVSKERAAQFMTAEEAAAAEITPRTSLDEAGEPVPPAATDVAEPEVRKKDEPKTGLQPADIQALGIAKRQAIYKRLIGKDMADPEQRKAVLEEIEKYLVRGNGSEESRAKLTAFKEQFAATQEVPNVDVPTGTEPEASGTGATVAGEPSAGTAPEGVGEAEPAGVVPTAENAGQPSGGEGRQPPAVAPAPTFTEADIDDALARKLITPEQAERARGELLAELRAQVMPDTAMGSAFERAINDVKAQMDALRQKNGKAPAPKSKNRAKYDALKVRLDAMLAPEDGDVAERLERVGASGVFQVRDSQPELDVNAVRDSLLKVRASPKMTKAVLAYIGIDNEGHFLSTTYSTDEAAKYAGLSTSSGKNVWDVVKQLGLTAEVVRRFHANQSTKFSGMGASESGTGITDLNPKRGTLYEPPKGKAQAKTAKFLRPALTENGTLDFTKVPLDDFAKMYVQASVYDMDRNADVLMQLRAEVDRRTKEDPKAKAAISRAYGKLIDDGEPLEIEEDFDDTEGDSDVEEDSDIAEEVPDTVEEDSDFVEEVSDTVKEGRTETRNREDEELFEDSDFYDAGVESEARDGASAYPDIEPEEAKRIEDQVRGKSLIEAAEFLAGYFKVGDQKLIAQRVVERLRRMEAAGFKFEFVLVEPGVRAPSAVASGAANGLSSLTFEDGKPVIKVYIRAADMGSSGVNPRIMLHEFLHAATQAAIHLGNMRGAAGTNTAKLAGALIDLQNAFIKHFNQRISDSRAGKATLTEMEEAILKRNINAGLDPHELLAWGLTSPKFQQYLETIPYKARSMWTAFVEAIRNFLGMAPRVDTALSELLHVSEEILNADPYEEIAIANRIFGKQSASGNQAAAITGQSKAAAQMGRATGTQAPVKPASGNAALRLRQKFADSMASMEEFFVNAYGGATRSASGRLNPMVLLSRALDAGRVSKAVQMEGGLTHQDGLIVAGELRNAEGQPVSYAGVLKRIADTAKANKTTYEEYRTTIDEVLYGHREFNLREQNRDIEAKAQALEAAGKKPQADKLRERLVELLLTDAQIDARESAFQNDSFIKGVSADLDTIRFNLLDMLVSTGRISAEMATDYKDAIGYIPFKRIGDYEQNWVDAGRGANRGAAALKNRRNLEGSGTRQSTSVVENFSGLIDWATTESMKNEAATRALGDMTLLGAAEQRDRPPAEDSPGGMARVYENGQATTYYVPDPLHLATFSMTDPQLSGIVKGLSAATRLLRAGVTSMPPFAVKQVFDDIVRAYTFAGVKGNAEMARNILFKFPGNWVREMFGKKSPQVRELERLGVIGTFDFTRESNLKDVMADAGAQERGIGATILRVMEAGAKASDISVRAAVYQQVLKETGDKAQAESAAREIINFSRRGSSKAMNLMISIVPFFNAYARGMDKMATAMAGGKLGRTTSTVRSMFYKRMGVLTAMGIAYALMMQDDEEYQALPNHVRDTNWILPFGKDLGFTPAIPVPPELAFFFKAIPERIIQYYKYHGTEEERAMPALLKEMLLRGVDIFSSPNVTPQLLRPVLENMVNYSFFMGRPLESQAQMELRPSERYGVGTSDAMKALSSAMTNAATATGVEALEISPIKLENFIRGMFGTAAGLGLSVADMALNPQRTDRPLHQQLAPQLTGASALMKNPVGSRYIDEIYSLDRRVTQAYNTLKRLQERDPEKVEAFERDNAGMLAIHGDVQAVMGAIREANKLSIALDRDTSLSPEERRKAIDELRTEQNDIARQVFSLRKMARDIQAER